MHAGVMDRGVLNGSEGVDRRRDRGENLWGMSMRLPVVPDQLTKQYFLHTG